jgi:hypothetical protein
MLGQNVVFVLSERAGLFSFVYLLVLLFASFVYLVLFL